MVEQIETNIEKEETIVQTEQNPEQPVEKKKFNYFILATIILGVIALSLIAYQLYEQNKVINLYGLEIKQSDFNKIVHEVEKTGQPMKYCNMELNKCFVIDNIPIQK